MKLTLILVLTLIVLPQTAFAHAELVSSTPAAGTTLEAVPQTMTFTFNEPIGEDSTVALIDAQFRRTELPSRPDEDVLIVEMPSELANGTYSVEFDAVSADGHTVLGSIQFQIATDNDHIREPIVLLGIMGAVIVAAVAKYLVSDLVTVHFPNLAKVKKRTF